MRAVIVLVTYVVGLMLVPTALHAAIGDVTLRTDHPHYPGEGAFQTVDDCVRFATNGQKSEQDQAIALYKWILAHQWHLTSPQEPLAPGLSPDTAQSHEELIVFDANRARFSYGYALCGTVHAWNEPYWRALGMNARRRAFPGHTNSEIKYGGAWHAFDTDMAGLVFRNDGIVAGYDDIIADVSLVKHSRPPIPCYPFAWPGDFEGMKEGWKEVAAGGEWFKMYNSGYAAQPGIVALRRGESLARYWDRDHFGGPAKRRFWHHQKGGPFRDWTFVNQGEPKHEGEKSNSRGNASYANGVFDYRPPLASAACFDGAIAKSRNIAVREASPRLHSRDDQPATIEFTHFSPYVICGDPLDDANPMTGKATDGLVIRGKAVGDVSLQLSVDGGQTWLPARKVTGEFKLDLTDDAKGRYGWRAKFAFAGGAGLDELQFNTTTQVCQAIYPRLSSGGSTVTYRAAERSVAAVLPNWALDDERIASVEAKELRSPNVQYQPRSKGNRYAYQTTNNKPGQVVFRVSSPAGPLQEVHAAARYKVRVPPPEGCDFHLAVSTDGGKAWSKFAAADTPEDNEFSSGWVYGSADIAAAKVSEALVRVNFYQGGYATGLIDAQVYGVHEAASAGRATVTYGWREAGQAKTHVERMAAGEKLREFRVPTGADIVDDFVRIEVE